MQTVEQSLYEIRKKIIKAKDILLEKNTEKSLREKELKENFGITLKQIDEEILILEKQNKKDQRRLDLIINKIETEIRKYN